MSRNGRGQPDHLPAPASKLVESVAVVLRSFDLSDEQKAWAESKSEKDNRFAVYVLLGETSEIVRQLVEYKIREECKTRTGDSSLSLSGVQLAKRVTAAAAEWASSGFRLCDDGTVKARRAACRDCEYNISPPATVLYQGIRLIRGANAKICAACGCDIATKTRLRTERCPQPSSWDPALSRWNEPIEMRRLAKISDTDN